MRGALLSALPQCGSEPIMIVSGNDVIDPSGYKSLIDSNGDGAILAQKVDQYFPGGYLTLENDRITGIVEKPGEGNEPSNLVNIVAHAHKDPVALLAALQDVDKSSDDGYEQALQKLFGTLQYHAVPYEGVWQAVKYPWHLLQLLPILLNEITEQSIHPSATVHETVVITGNVVIDEGAKIFPHATIVGPCYIGKRSIVANNALVRGSCIGDDCVVGYSCEVKDSLLHSHVWSHMSYIGDSVVGRNVSFGGGSVTGNLRFDEQAVSSKVNGTEVNTGLIKFGNIIGDDCRLGIQSGTSPGVKIGSGSFIGSKVLVEEDVPEKSFLRMRNGTVQILENKADAPQPEARESFRKAFEDCNK